MIKPVFTKSKTLLLCWQIARRYKIALTIYGGGQSPWSSTDRRKLDTAENRSASGTILEKKD